MSFLDTLTSINVRKTEVTLPIAKLPGTITPLLVGDDLSLKSSMVSPVNYERDIVKLLHKHTELYQDNEPLKLSFNEFIEKISNIDKISLLWGLYKATYKDLGKRKVICDNCEAENNIFIDMDMLVQPDTFAVWDEELPFYEYEYPICCLYGDVIYVFYTKLPSIKDHITLLSIVPARELRANIENIGMIFTRPLQLALITNRIEIYDKPKGVTNIDDFKLDDIRLKNGSEDSYLKASTKSLQEILIAFEEHMPYDISEKLLAEYNNRFSKYTPKFYTKFNCVECGNEITFDVDIELVFLRRTLFGPEETGESI